MAAGIPSDEDDDPSIEGNTNHNQLLEEGLYELSVVSDFTIDRVEINN